MALEFVSRERNRTCEWFSADVTLGKISLPKIMGGIE